MKTKIYRFIVLVRWIVFCVFLCGSTLMLAHANAADRNAEKSLIVLAYHEIGDTKQALFPEYAVSLSQFKQQLQWLRDRGYQFISTEQWLQAQQGKSRLPEKSVLLSVDDGYASFYQSVYPFLKQQKIPALLAVVGAWLEPKKDNIAHHLDGQEVFRQQFVSWPELKEMQDSGWVEIASHSYDLHQGILANPQGNTEPAMVSRNYDPLVRTYETDQAYQARIYQDFNNNQKLFKSHGINNPRVMVWPYGRYNHTVRDMAQQFGMPLSLSLNESPIQAKASDQQLNRLLVKGDMRLIDFARAIQSQAMNLTDHYRPQKIMHVDLDYIYDPDAAQQERNLGYLLDRIIDMQVNTIFLQAFADPDANGSADQVYFPNRHIPMRADLFNRVTWQIQTRTQVKRIYAWMPLLAWELPAAKALDIPTVQTQARTASGHVDMGYYRLSPFSASARQVIREIYQDLAKSASFNGLLFHDDATLSDFEDSGPDALRAYAAAGLTTDLEQVRKDVKKLKSWTQYKTQILDEFALQLADDVRQFHPTLMTARNLYAQVALEPESETWYAQSLKQSLKHYDFTAIMAMPYMEQAPNHQKFYQNLVKQVKRYPEGLNRTIFELQAVDWRTNKPVPSSEMAETIRSLYQQGALHVGYYPDNPFNEHPDTNILRKAFSYK